MYIDERLLRAAKVAAAREGKAEYEIFEDALRKRLTIGVLERIWERTAEEGLSEEEAMAIATAAVKEVRKKRPLHKR